MAVSSRELKYINLGLKFLEHLRIFSWRLLHFKGNNICVKEYQETGGVSAPV